MNILQVCPHPYERGSGGISEHVRCISERLAKRHDVTVYATDPSGMLPRYELINGVKVERYRRFAPSNAYFFSWELLLKLRNARFDVVHGHGYHAFPMHIAPLANTGKFVVTTHFHGGSPSVFRNCLYGLFKPVGEISLTKADAIIAVSEFEKRLLCTYFKLEADKIVVIPNGLDLSEFACLKRRRRGFRSILYVGRLERSKGVQFLVEVLPQLDNDVVLEMVGKGSLREFLENRAKQLGVRDRVLFFQNLSRRDLLQKYVDSDAFVLLSQHEAYSLVVAEALTAGAYCIVANTSGLSEWVDGVNCFGLGLPLDLTELKALISDVFERKGQKFDVKMWKSKILDWDEVVAQLEHVYCS